VTTTIITVLVSFFIPGVSALLARGAVPANVAGFITPLLAAANGLLGDWANNPGHYQWQAGVTAAAVSYVLAVAAHLGLWKGTATYKQLLRLGNAPGSVT
jgi:hypothetical protein